MMLNHINLPVADIGPPRDFLVKYCGMRTTRELGRGTMAILRDEGGMVLILSRFDKSAEIHYPRDFHVGCFVDAREEVSALHARMRADGVEVEPPQAMPGRFGFYVTAPGGLIVEVATFEGKG